MASSLRFLTAGAVSALFLLLATNAGAAGGSYVFDGGTAAQRAQVRAALDASAFDWNLVPATITIHIARGVDSHSRPGHIWLDADLLDAGKFAWAVVQDEYAHQVDYHLLDADTRPRLNAALGGTAWCHGAERLRHDDYGCERFASMLVWAYWPSADNAYRPRSSTDESAAMPPAEFRRLMAQLVGAAELVAAARTLSSAAPRKRAPAAAKKLPARR